MNFIVNFLKLIRWQNLAIIVLTQYLLRHCIIQPLMQSLAKNVSMIFLLQMSDFEFFILVLSTVLIAAAGNIINDYFDLKIDRINKPQKIIVGRHIKRRVAMVLHIVFSALGILLGFYVSFSIGVWKLALIHVFAVMSLWYYSTHFKHHVFTGNFIIALLAAIIPLIVGLYEIPLLNYRYGLFLHEFNANFNFISFWILGYAVFAFLFTLAREIIKDIADMEGDDYCGSYTIPIAYGINAARYISSGIYFLILILIGTAWYNFLNDKATLIYILFVIGIPFAIAIYKTLNAKNRKEFLAAEKWNKITSVAGILYALIARYIILNGPIS